MAFYVRQSDLWFSLAAAAQIKTKAYQLRGLQSIGSASMRPALFITVGFFFIVDQILRIVFAAAAQRRTKAYKLRSLQSVGSASMRPALLITVIFIFSASIRLSFLHLGQNSGNLTSTVSSLILLRVLLPQTGHRIHSHLCSMIT